MTSKLSRQGILHEVDQLDHEIGDLIRRIGPAREKLSHKIQQKLRELEDSIPAARQLVSSNAMDVRRAEVGLMQLRAIKAEIVNSLNGSKF